MLISRTAQTKIDSKKNLHVYEETPFDAKTNHVVCHESSSCYHWIFLFREYSRRIGVQKGHRYVPYGNETMAMISVLTCENGLQIWHYFQTIPNENKNKNFERTIMFLL